jgi:hypothetical protein
MNLIKCIIQNQSDHRELDRLELLLPAVPAVGNDNFDIRHNGVLYNCSVISVDWRIEEQQFSHCSIYIL